MNKTLKISIFILVLFFTFHKTGNAYSHKLQTKKPMTIEEVYKAEGYTNFKVAIKKFEKKYHSKITLPQKIPFKVKYKYAKVEEKYSQVSFDYVGEKFKGNQLQVIIGLNKLGEFKGGYYYDTKNGTKVFIRQYPIPHNHHTLLSFKKDTLHYYLILSYQDKDLEKNKIIEIAHSFNI